jgi:type III secretory pathway component EscU
MLLFFIYNFCMFKWWYHDYFVTLNIVASFISNLFQIVVVLLLWLSFVDLKIHRHQYIKKWNAMSSIFLQIMISKDKG